MIVPPKDHPNWTKIILDQQCIQFEFLATKILLGRLNLRTKQDPTVIDDCVDELRDFFIKNEDLPKVSTDLEKIFS